MIVSTLSLSLSLSLSFKANTDIYYDTKFD